MLLNVAELQPVLHELFTTTADFLAKQTGFCQRARKLSGSVFARTLVFGLLQNPDATLDDFADFALQHLHVDASAQAFDQRFSPTAAPFLHALLQEAFSLCFASTRNALLPLLRHFNGVYLRDATTVALPAELAEIFPAGTVDGKPTAALKVVLEVEVTSGQYTELSLLPGKSNDKRAAVSDKPLPAGCLLLEDMGFLCGARLQRYIDEGVYVLTRVPCWTAFFTKNKHGKGFLRLDLLKWLRRITGDRAERTVYVFRTEKIALRLLAVRVPAAEAEQRRQRVLEEAKKLGRAVSQKKLDLCEWSILVTNAPATLLRAYNAWQVRTVRWQVELVFKLFKSEGGLGRTRSSDPHRVMAEILAKLLGMLVQQWVLLAAGYVMLVHSARRAARRVRRLAAALLESLAEASRFAEKIGTLAVMLRRRCRIEHRHNQPSTFDRLAALDAEFRDMILAA